MNKEELEKVIADAIRSELDCLGKRNVTVKDLAQSASEAVLKTFDARGLEVVPCENPLIQVLARLFKEEKLEDRHGEDVIGVLMKSGIYQFFEEKGGLVKLADKIESAMKEIE